MDSQEDKDESNRFNCLYPLPFFSEEEEGFLKPMEAKHMSQCSEFNFEPLMSIIKKIFQYSSFQWVPRKNGFQESNNNKFSINKFDLESNIRYTIYRLASLIWCESASDVDGHEIITDLLDVLCTYTWEARVVLILAAFAMSYGDFSLTVLQHTHENPLAQFLCMLKQPPLLERKEARLHLHFTSLSKLVEKMVELATWIIEFKKYMEEHGITDLEPPLTKVLHMVTYRFIKIVVTCSSYNARLIKMDTEYTAPDTEKQLECFGRDLLDVHDYVTEYMTTIAYKEVQNLFQNENKDIHQLFIKLFFKGNALNGGQIGLAELKGNSVAFLISDVNVNMERFTVLEKTYNKIHEDKGFKIIWIPMLDPSVQWTIIKEQSLYNLAYLMPWYWCHPSMVTKAFFRYIVEQWNFQGNSILVVLDKRWNLISANALPMVETWGASAFPFSSNMDKELCIKQSWTIQSMVEDLEIMKPDDRSQIVCLYGGDDLDLIKSFLKAIGIISDATSNHIETVYVGTNERMENIQNIIDFIKDMNGTCLSETIMSSFWNRLDIILKLKREHCIAPDEDTVTMQMKTLLGYRREGLWTTMMYKGSMKFLKLTEAQLLKWFNIFAETRSPFEGTDNLWKSLIQELKKLEHSMHIIQLGNEGELLEKKRCPECGCVMDLYVLQKCTPYCGHIFAQGTEGDVVTNTICPKCKDTMKFEIVYKCHPMV